MHVHAAPPPRARLYAKSPAEYHVPSVTSLQHKTAPLRRVSGAPSTARAARGCKAANSVLASASGAPHSLAAHPRRRVGAARHTATRAESHAPPKCPESTVTATHRAPHPDIVPPTPRLLVETTCDSGQHSVSRHSAGRARGQGSIGMCRADREHGASVAEGAGARRTRRKIAAAAASRIPVRPGAGWRGIRRCPSAHRIATAAASPGILLLVHVTYSRNLR